MLPVREVSGPSRVKTGDKVIYRVTHFNQDRTKSRPVKAALRKNGPLDVLRMPQLDL